MIKPLRKAHFITWHILGLILPLSIMAAVAWRPGVEPSYVDTNMFSVKAVHDTDSVHHLIIEVQKPLNTASCAVYYHDQLLGLLTHQGTYQYSIVACDSITLTMKDFIKDKIITTIPVTLTNTRQ